MYLEQPYDEPGTLTGSYSNQKQQYASGASDMMNRPNRGRRSSSGVANDHGLASAAAMTAHSHATYKNDPPKTPISMRFVKARQSALTPPQSPTKDGGMKASLRSSPHTAASTEVLPPSPPQQSNKPESEDQSEESHFPKTLRHTAKQLKNALVNGRSEEERPIPLSLKSPRRSGKKSSSSGPSSYNKLADSTSLPVPPSNPKGATQNITPPQPNGPASAKSMRHPAVRDQPITSQQEQMIDPSSPIDKGKGKQRSSPLVNEVVAEEADTEIAQDDGILPTDSVTPSLEEGSFLSAKTLRHPKEVKQKKGENPIFSRIPLSGKTLRRPAEERRGSFFSRFKPNISRHTSNVSSEGPAPVGQNTETWVQETATMPGT